MNIVNYTPHAITIKQGSVATVTVPPSGKVARVTTVESFGRCIYVGSLAVISNRRTLEVVEIPEVDVVNPGDGGESYVPHWIIVSSMVLEAAKAQNHPLLHRLCAPDTGPTAIREGGQVIAVTRLVVA